MYVYIYIYVCMYVYIYNGIKHGYQIGADRVNRIPSNHLFFKRDSRGPNDHQDLMLRTAKSMP